MRRRFKKRAHQFYIQKHMEKLRVDKATPRLMLEIRTRMNLERYSRAFHRIVPTWVKPSELGVAGLY